MQLDQSIIDAECARFKAEYERKVAESEARHTKRLREKQKEREARYAAAVAAAANDHVESVRASDGDSLPKPMGGDVQDTTHAATSDKQPHLAPAVDDQQDDQQDGIRAKTSNEQSRPRPATDNSQDGRPTITSTEQSRPIPVVNSPSGARNLSQEGRSPSQDAACPLGDVFDIFHQFTSQWAQQDSNQGDEDLNEDASELPEGHPTTPPAAKKRRVSRRKSTRSPPIPIYKAKVGSLADRGSAEQRCATGMDEAIISKIKKCLDRAHHPNTLPSEADAAQQLAIRLMSQHNVTQAEVLQSENGESHQQYAGKSTVLIERTDGDNSKAVRTQSFLTDLFDTMSESFNCKSYYDTGYSSLEVTFYGIASNTVAAAMGLEVAYNLIVEWAREVKGTHKKNSYCLGAASGYRETALKEKAAEEAKAKQVEEEMLMQQDRDLPYKTSASIPVRPSRADSAASSISTSPPPGEAPLSRSLSPESEDDSDKNSVAGQSDFSERDEADLQTPGIIGSSLDRARSASPDVQGAWHSHTQLVRFRNTANEIADEYLKSQNFKLYSSKGRNRTARDRDSFNKGEKDGKTIDVHRKTIEGAGSSV